MRITTEDGQDLEVLYTDGYFTVSKVVKGSDNNEEVSLSEDLSIKEYKRSLKTFAHVTGLVNKLKEFSYIVENADTFSKELKLESCIERAKVGNKLKKAKSKLK